MNDPPSTFRELVDESIQIDNRNYKLRMKRQSKHGQGRPNWRTQRHDYGDPMDLDALNDGRPSRSRGFRGRQNHGGNKEREKRRRDNLCYNCGKSGHRARECKRQAHGLHMINDETAGMLVKKADTSMDKTCSDLTRGPGTAQKGPIDAQEKRVPPEHEKPANHDRLSWTACYKDTCTTHYSDKHGSGWFPHGKDGEPWQQAEKKKKLQTIDEEMSLSMMNAERPPKESEWDSEIESSEEEIEIGAGDQKKCYVSQINRQYVIIIINWWKRVLCATQCEEPR